MYNVGREGEYDMSDKTSKVLLCYHCGNKTYMDKVQDFTAEAEAFFPLDNEQRRWDIYYCHVCSDITIEKRTWGPLSNGTRKLKDLKIIYPVSRSERGSNNIPSDVLGAFEAAHKVRHIDGAVCALALRRTLEKLCKDMGETKGDLYEKLNGLSQKNILPPILGEAAYVLRKLGNAAAHADEKDFPEHVVTALIDFTQTILDYVYNLPQKLKKIQGEIGKSGQAEIAATAVIVNPKEISSSETTDKEAT